MAKSSKTDDTQARDEAFQIIELATQDIETLTRAFNLISEVCEELGGTSIKLAESNTEVIIN